VLFLLAILSTSYAVLSVKLVGERKYSLTIGTLDFKLDNEKNAIRLMNAYPMSDEEGQALTPYTFTLTNNGTLKEYYKISLVADTKQQASCSGCEFLSPDKLRYSLKINGVEGSAKAVREITTLDSGEVSPNQTINYELRLWLRSEATIEEENKYYFGKIKVDASQEEVNSEVVIAGKTFTVNYSSATFPDFSQVSSETNGRGIYKYTEDGEDIYYWRGAVTDNHVIFAGYCWEMVRTTKTGGVKMIYDGVPVELDGVQTCPNTGASSQLTDKSTYNSLTNDNAYVGYMYGLTELKEELSSPQCIKLNSAGTQAEVGTETTEAECTQTGGKWATTAYEATHANIVNSTIKTAIDTWFSTSIINTNTNLVKIEDAVYCNNRDIDIVSGYGTALGYGTNPTAYTTRYRLSFLSYKTPNLECTNLNDRFTITKDNGNGALTYPVGLLTADEIALAGGVYGSSNSSRDYYLYTGETFWSLSPYRFDGSMVTGFVQSSVGYMDGYDVLKSRGIRPVISLISETKFSTGNGTETNPFIVEN